MFTEMLQTHVLLNVMTCFIQEKKKLYLQAEALDLWIC